MEIFFSMTTGGGNLLGVLGTVSNDMKTILVIDDEALLRLMLREILTSSGHIFVGANNGVEAIDLLSRKSPDLVMIDHHLPDIDGLTLLKEIKILAPQTKTIFMSGRHDNILFRDSKKAGADVVLAKPFDIGKLLDEIEDLFNLARQERLSSPVDKKAMEVAFPIVGPEGNFPRPVLLKEGRHKVFVKILGTKKGEDHHIFDVYISYLQSESKDIGTVVSIEESQQLYRQRQGRLEALDKLLALRETAASTAHEIRNPLASLKGFLQLLEGGFNPEDPRKDYVAIMLSEVNRINRLVEDFLSSARYRHLQSISVRELILHGVKILGASPLASKVIFHMNFHGEHRLEIMGDWDNILQAFLNILKNSCEASNNGHVWVDAYSEKDKIILSIKNEGAGIDAPTLKNIFTPYSTTKENGTGLGLYITKQIVENHGGTIYVKSKPGEGATFYMSFPKTF